MTQNWGTPNYPPRPPQYIRPPQYQPPEEIEPDYDDDPPRGRSPLFYFFAGGCLVLLLVGCCVLTTAVGWVIDTKYGITSPKETPMEEMAPLPESSMPQPVAPGETTPIVPGVAPTAPANAPVDSVGMGQPIVAPSGVELTVFDLQRKVSLNNLAAAEGMEFVAVSVGLKNTATGNLPFTIEEFTLRNGEGLEYQPDPQADNGRRLNNGQLAAGQSIEGDLLFHVIDGDAPLALIWTPVGSEKSLVVLLQ